MTRRDWLLLTLPLAAAGCNGTRSPRRPAASTRERAVDFLLKRQAADGGWHSETYGLTRSGQSLTPFVLLALLESGAPVPDRCVDRALQFVADRTDKGGCLGRADSASVDYPNYGTGLALRAIARSGRGGWDELSQRMVRFLRGQQLNEDLGWRRADAAYGAWGIGGARRHAPHAGHVDLSMTRHVLEGLRAVGVASGDPVFERASVFVERCQNFAAPGDGGFFFSTVVLDANKAGESGGRFKSYGTMTADGVLALRAIGRASSGPRIEAAKRWLAANHRPDGAPGFHGDMLQRWTRGLWYYYACAHADLGLAPDARLRAALEGAQRPDGSWANPEPLVKEDDPIIATGFALQAILR